MKSQSLKPPQDRQHQRHPVNWKQQSLAHTSQILPDKFLRTHARSKAQQGNYPEAIALLNQLITRHPKDAIDYNNRGLIYFQSGQLFPAIADYNTAIQLKPTLASAYNNRANCYAACGQLTEALADYDKAIDLNPSYVRAWINRGITLRELGKYEQAAENFDIAEILGQLPANTYAERGRTYHLWGDWNLAIADYRRALELISDDNLRLRYQVETWLAQLIGS